MRGSLAGGAVDAVDLYRFSVARRSSLELSLDYDGTGSARIDLFNDAGGRMAGSESELSRRISPGRYFVAVRTRDGGSGRYVLRRVSRTITSTATTIEGTRSAKATPGHSVRISVEVTPDASGPVTYTIEHFDPLAGWHFLRQVRGTVSAGAGGITFTPPSEGRWRVRTAFEGTRIAAPSQSGYATLLAAPPLEP